MRTTFAETLFVNAKKNKKIMLLTADLGYSVFEKFINEVPNQYLNAGIAEQNMTGLAAGLAIEGKIPVIYSIIPFITMRNFEQVRNDICYQNLKVIIVGVGSGFSYGTYGHSHHGLEDMGVLRTLPNLTIISPCDPEETRQATKWALLNMGPTYIRLGKAGEPKLHSKPFIFKIGKGIILKNGSMVTIISTGAITKMALETARLCEKKDISVRVVSMYSIKPIDQKLILRCAKETKSIFTLEEHSVVGGLGSAVAEVLAENQAKVYFKRIGISDNFTKKMGRQEFMREINGLSVENISNLILQSLKKDYK